MRSFSSTTSRTTAVSDRGDMLFCLRACAPEYGAGDRAFLIAINAAKPRRSFNAGLYAGLKMPAKRRRGSRQREQGRGSIGFIGARLGLPHAGPLTFLAL